MLLTLTVSLLENYVNIILWRSIAFSDIFEGPNTKDYFTHPHFHSIYEYADADKVGCLDTPRSATEWCMLLGSSPFSFFLNGTGQLPYLLEM